MSNALMTIDVDQLPSIQVGSDEDFADLAKGGDFLGRLQLCGKGKYIDKGLIRPGHYGIPESADEIEDLGNSVDVIPFARKAKAVDMRDKDAIITSYDKNSDLFQKIKTIAEQKTSGDGMSGCMYGVSFLMFERATGRFLEFFCSSKSTRSEAKKIYAYLPLTQIDIDAKVKAGMDMEGVKPHGPLPMTLKSRLVEGKFSYWVPVAVKCSTPFSNVPSMDAIHREMTRFLSNSDGGVEVVDDDNSGKKGRAR
jgi:hypothetical protein